MQTRMRMIAAGAVVALLTGTAGAAAAASTSTASAAASTSSPAPKPSPTGTNDGGKPGDQQAWFAKLAAKLHVSVPKLESALRDAKMTIGTLGVAPTDPKVVAVIEHDLGISADQAKWLITQVFGAGPKPGPGKGGPGNGGQGGSGKGGGQAVPESVVAHTLAGFLHVSDARAAQVLTQLEQMSRETALTDPRFEAVAASLHITPQQLVNAIDETKQAIAAHLPTPGKS